MDLGSDVVTEVEIQPEMEEVEIDSLPVDMHLSGDELEISVDDDVTLGHEVMLESQDDDDYGDDPSMSLEHGLLLDHDDDDDDDDDDDEDDGHAGPSHFHHVTIPSFSHNHKRHNSKLKAANMKKRYGNRMLSIDPVSSNGHHMSMAHNPNHQHNRTSKKWEPKQVQIRTLEGAFSVTMWASGADDGKQTSILGGCPCSLGG